MIQRISCKLGPDILTFFWQVMLMTLLLTMFNYTFMKISDNSGINDAYIQPQPWLLLT